MQMLQNPVIRTETKNGEITINLNLTIKLEGGAISVEATANPVSKLIPQVKPPEKKLDYEIPEIDFIGEDELITFGKDIVK